jgi:hypothetical protein
LRLLLFYGLGLLCFIATILPFCRNETWWVRACDFPRMQIATMSAATLAAVAAFTELNVLSSTLAFVLLGCLGVQLAVILPYTPLRAVEVQRTDASAGPRILSLVIANVFMPNRQIDRLKDTSGRRIPIWFSRSRPTSGGAGNWSAPCRSIRSGSPMRCRIPTA